MHTEIETISPTRKKLIISASEEDRALAHKKILRKYVAEKEIRGYRKGKAPEARVAAEFAAAIEADAFTAMFENAVDAAVRENNLQVQERVSIDDVKRADGGLTVLGGAHEGPPIPVHRPGSCCLVLCTTIRMLAIVPAAHSHITAGVVTGCGPVAVRRKQRGRGPQAAPSLRDPGLAEVPAVSHLIARAAVPGP